MTDCEKWKDRYERKWATKEQLQRLVSLGVLTSEGYEQIVNEQ